MSQNVRLLESVEISVGCINADFNSDQTTSYVSLAKYDGCLVVLTKPAGTAGDDLLFTLKQAQDVSGTGVKALNIKTAYIKAGTLTGSQTGVKTFTRYDLTTAGTFDTSSFTGTSYTDDGAGVARSALDLNTEAVEMVAVLDVRASDLDVSNGFKTITYFNDGTKVANALVCCVLFISYNGRYPSRIPLSAIVN